MNQLFTLGGQSIGVSASISVLPMNIQDWFPLGWACSISLQSKGPSRVFIVQLSHPYLTIGKTIALNRRTFVGKVMSLFFNMLSVITFLPRSKRLLISWLQSPSAVILEPPKIKSATVSTVSPSICHEVRELDAMIFVFWMLSFKPKFSLSSFTFIMRLFSSSSLSAIRVVSFVNLRLLIFLPSILIPACASSSPQFLMMYSTYKLNKQGDNIQPWCTPFPIWNQSVVPCPVLTVASWLAYKFLKRQVRWSGIHISFRIFHISCDPHSQRLGIVNKAEIYIFLELCCFFFFFFPFIFISWRLITLQYCSGFCHTLTWVSHGFTCVLIHIFTQEMCVCVWVHACAHFYIEIWGRNNHSCFWHSARHTWDIAHSVPGHHFKVSIAIKQVRWIFWFPIVYKSLHHTVVH